MSDQRYRVDRRRFLRDSAFVSLGIVAAACAPGTTPAASGGGTAKKGGEFHAAWPWDLPPKGHYNYLSAGAVVTGSYIMDLFLPSLGVYRWAEGKWENWLMESAAQTGENYEVKLKQGLKWDDGKEFTSADVATTYWVGRSQSFGIWTYADKIDVSSVTAAQLTMPKNPGGLFADKVNFDKIVVYQGETDAVTPLVLAGDIDYATHGFPLATDKAFGDNGLRVVRGPLYTGPAIFFHWPAAPEFQDKRLRQAVAMAINKPESATITYGQSAKAQKFMAGVSDNIVPLWLSAADQGKLKSYDYDLAAAAKLM